MPAATSSSAPQTAEIRFAQVASGARIAWARHGRGPVLVRVAHWMTHVEHDLRSPIWKPWLDRLGRGLEVVRYDERGCGLSGSDDVPLGLDASTEELSAVVAATGAPRVALLGQSGAAAPAIAYAVRHPERVSHLVLLGGYLAGLLHQSPSTQTLAFHEASLRLVELGWGRRDPAVQQFFTTRFIPDASQDEARALNEQQRLSCGAARAVQIMRARTLLDVRALAPLVQCPTWCCTPRATRSCRCRWAATSLQPSPARASSPCPPATTSPWQQTPPSSCSASPSPRSFGPNAQHHS